MASDEQSPLVAVLAAGRGSRFGGGKLDASCAGKPVGQWVLDAVSAAGLPPGFLVVPQEVPAFAGSSKWKLITNDKADAGLGSSLAVAASLALEEQRRLLVLLADMPLVEPEHIAALASADGLAATSWPGGRAGVPAIFPLSVLPALVACTGNGGAGEFLSSARDLQVIPVKEYTLLDVDRWSDLERAEIFLSRRG